MWDMDPIEIYLIIPNTADFISCTRIPAWKRGCHKLFLIDSKFGHVKWLKPIKLKVVTRMDTPKSDCHLHSKYMIEIL